jgi:membrane protein DedA with SNARE-associated domain
VFWNALGGIAWATSVGLTIYFLGRSAKGAVEDIGLGGLGLGAAVAVGYVVYRVVKRRRRLAASGSQGQGQSREHEGQ